MHLQACMEKINNYFVPLSADQRTYTIAEGVISPLFDAAEGDRFLVCGSRRNDGVYTYHANGITNDDDTEAAGLCDETFAGTIRVCAVPPAVLALSREKSEWEATHSGELNGALASESFNGYSYTLKTGKNGGVLTWFDTQAGQTLERWRRPFI